MQERRRRADSVTAVAGATGPVLLWTSAHDDTVAPAQTSALAAAFRAGGKDVTVLTVAGREHRFDGPDGASGLTTLGRQAATELLAWLQARFPAD
jgi:dienelactone hydrolase